MVSDNLKNKKTGHGQGFWILGVFVTGFFFQFWSWSFHFWVPPDQWQACSCCMLWGTVKQVVIKYSATEYFWFKRTMYAQMKGIFYILHITLHASCASHSIHTTICAQNMHSHCFLETGSVSSIVACMYPSKPHAHNIHRTHLVISGLVSLTRTGLDLNCKRLQKNWTAVPVHQRFESVAVAVHIFWQNFKNCKKPVWTSFELRTLKTLTALDYGFKMH